MLEKLRDSAEKGTTTRINRLAVDDGICYEDKAVREPRRSHRRHTTSTHKNDSFTLMGR